MVGKPGALAPKNETLALTSKRALAGIETAALAEQIFDPIIWHDRAVSARSEEAVPAPVDVIAVPTRSVQVTSRDTLTARVGFYSNRCGGTCEWRERDVLTEFGRRIVELRTPCVEKFGCPGRHTREVVKRLDRCDSAALREERPIAATVRNIRIRLDVPVHLKRDVSRSAERSAI